MRLTIVTGMWKRPEVFNMWCKGVNALLEYYPNVDLQVVVAGSEGRASRDLVEPHGYHYIETPNTPLAEKMNKTIYKARELGSDYVLCVGSDDIVTPELLGKYLEYIENGYDFIGVLDWYFYDTATHRALYWGGYADSRAGATCGAGRVLSKWLLDKWDWRIWENKHSHVLDNSMEEKLELTPHRHKTFRLKDLNLFALDIKSSTNMTPFKRWDNSVFIDPDVIREIFKGIW
jgi:hypothetical protein